MSSATFRPPAAVLAPRPPRLHSSRNSRRAVRRARRTPHRRGMSLKGMVIALVLLAALGTGGWYLGQSRGWFKQQAKSTLITETVKRGPLVISLVERGNLESSANVTLQSRVEGTTAIIWIKEEGTAVKAGEDLVKLDASKFKLDAQQQEIALENAKAAEKQAEKNLEIVHKQNDSDIAAAKLKLELAVLDLAKYQKGEYEQLRKTCEGDIQLATVDLTRAEDQYKFSKQQAMKGYATQTKLEGDRVTVEKAKITLDKAREALRVLEDFDKERQLKERQANADEFVRELERVKIKAEGYVAQMEATYNASRLIHANEQKKLDQMNNQIANCTIKAPQDGLVVYANERSSRGGSGGDVVIAEGTQVRERQAIINLPDVSKMRVNARIHESKIDKCREGLPVQIKVEAQPGEIYKGEVDNVSLVPLSGSFPNYNLKEYATTIAIKDDPEKVLKLKPGLTAEVEILVDQIESCLQVPIQGIVEQADKHFAFVVSAEQKVVRRELKTGRTNEVMIEVKDDGGLVEGDQVVLNPRATLPKEIMQLEADFPGKKGGVSEKFGDGKPPAVRDGSPAEGGVDVAAAKKKAQQGQSKGAFDPVAMFTRSDKNGDGKLSEDELSERMRPRFAEIDKNGDKFIDQAEFAAAPRGGGPGGGPPGGGGPGGPGGRQPGGAQ